MKSLYIFVDSERPDQYLNSLVHCVLQRDVRRIFFIHIKGLANDKDHPGNVDGLSGRVMGAVQAQLEGLSERGEYLFKFGPRLGERILLKTEYGTEKAKDVQSYYKRCRNLSLYYSNWEVDYNEIRNTLKTIAKEGSGTYVDVTAIKKMYLGDIIAVSLVEGLVGLYTFNLVNHSPDFERPWLSLIHALDSPTPAFQYTNIVNTEIYRNCARLVVLRSPSFRNSLIITFLVLLMSAAAYWHLGPQSPLTQAVSALSSVTGFLSLAFIFFIPRGK